MGTEERVTWALWRLCTAAFGNVRPYLFGVYRFRAGFARLRSLVRVPYIAVFQSLCLVSVSCYVLAV